MKYVVFGGVGLVTIDEFDTASGTLFGHQNAAGASAVGAAYYGSTPQFGVTPPLLEAFSSSGPQQILFQPDGTPLSSPEIRQKPNIVAPDGVNTTFFGSDTDGDGFPNFFGTSAAAPHAAAVAALLLEQNPALTPAGLYASLEAGAIDITASPASSGVDFASGAGLIQADQSLLAINAPPVATDDSYSVLEDRTLVVDAVGGVLSNDTDADADPLTASLVSDVSDGVLALSADGSFTYTPNTDFAGTDSFTYLANDGANNSGVATATIQVVNDVDVNLVPSATTLAISDTFTVDLQVVPNIDQPVDSVQAFVNFDPTVFQVVSIVNGDIFTTQWGDAALPGTGFDNLLGQADYLGGKGLSGTSATAPFTLATITFQAVGADPASAMSFNEPTGPPLRTTKAIAGALNVTGDLLGTTLKVNSAPVAVDDAYNTNEDTPLNEAAPGVLTNDTDADGDPLTASLVVASGPTDGTLTLNADGSFDYTPDPGFNGTDSFRYTASDGLLASNEATVSITVNAVNDPPVAADDAYAVDEDNVLNVALPGVLVNDSDPESDPLTSAIVVASGPANGTLTLNANGSFTYTPDADFSGSDSFRYTANDGLLDSNEATVTITVNAQPDAPVANDDAYNTNEDTPLNVAAPGVLTNDTDADGDPLTATLVVASGPTDGTLTLNPDGSFDYTPDPGFNGTDSFRYTASDGLLASNEATVTITISPL